MNWWCKRKRKVRVITLDKWECGSAYTLAVWLWKWNVSDSLWPHGLYSSWNSPGQNTGVGSLSLFQGIFPTQVLDPGLLQCRWILYQLSHKGSSRILEWVAYPFSADLPDPGIELGSPALQAGSWPKELICVIMGIIPLALPLRRLWALSEACVKSPSTVPRMGSTKE